MTVVAIIYLVALLISWVIITLNIISDFQVKKAKSEHTKALIEENDTLKDLCKQVSIQNVLVRKETAYMKKLLEEREDEDNGREEV